MSELLPALRKTENIGRSVFSRRAARRARNGTIIHEVFLESLEADSISVDRMDHATRRALAALSIQTGRNRTPPQDFHGWTVLTVDAAASNGRTVKATPDEFNRYHADIFLNLRDDKERRDGQIQHANELATLAKWWDAP